MNPACGAEDSNGVFNIGKSQLEGLHVCVCVKAFCMQGKYKTHIHKYKKGRHVWGSGNLRLRHRSVTHFSRPQTTRSHAGHGLRCHFHLKRGHHPSGRPLPSSFSSTKDDWPIMGATRRFIRERPLPSSFSSKDDWPTIMRPMARGRVLRKTLPA